MTEFEKWNDRFEKHWCTRLQLKMLVSLEVLTADDYESITGESYGE